MCLLDPLTRKQGKIQCCREPPWPRGSVRGLGAPGFQLRVLSVCLKGSVISFISSPSGPHWFVHSRLSICDPGTISKNIKKKELFLCYMWFDYQPISYNRAGVSDTILQTSQTCLQIGCFLKFSNFLIWDLYWIQNILKNDTRTINPLENSIVYQ